MSRKKRRRRPSSRPPTRRRPITLRDVGHADLLAVAAEHCATLAVRERDDDLEPVLLSNERHTDGRAGVLALVVGETRILLPERAFDDMVEIARVIRPIVESFEDLPAPVETLDELFELADVLGGVVGFGREDDGRTYQPLIVVILQSTRSTLARLQLGEAVMIDLDDL